MMLDLSLDLCECGHMWADHLPFDVVGCQHLTPAYEFAHNRYQLVRHDSCECKRCPPYLTPVRNLE